MLELENFITDRNIELIDEIRKQFRIVLEKNQDQDSYWSVSLENKVVTIKYGSEENIEECIAHELLHIKQIMLGFQKFKWAVSSADKKGYMVTICEAFDNELQHHKMYPEFIKMGYDKTKFYGISDYKDFPIFINNFLKKPDKEFLRIIPQYLSLTSAGSELVFEKLDDLKMQFRKIREGSLPRILDAIDKAIMDWQENDSLDVCVPITRVFSVIPGASHTYFSFSDEIKIGEGFFTGAPFELRVKGEEVEIMPT